MAEKDILIKEENSLTHKESASSSLAYDVTKRRLPLLEAVIKESLRLFPPVPIIARQIKQEVRLPRPSPEVEKTLICDNEKQQVKSKGESADSDDHGNGSYVIPADTSLAIDIYRIHRDPNVFGDPDAFNPDRFLNNNDSADDVFMPFSAGLRSCIGSKFALMEMKVIIFHIMTSFSIESVTPIDQLNLSQEIVLKPNNRDITIIFRDRNKTKAFLNKRFSL